jgi:Ca2+/Na+ antiporter
MKNVFEANTKYNNAMYFVALNSCFSMLALFVLSFYVKDMPLWLIISSGVLFFFVLYVFVLELTRAPNQIRINTTSIVFRFPMNRTKEYKLADIRYYATACWGGRAGHYHSVVMEFADGERIQIPSIKFEAYKEFLQYLRNSDIEFFAFIGQNNWRRKNKALSTKWVIPRYEKELEAEIGKNKGLLFLYFLGACLFFMNAFILYALIFIL